MKQVFAHDFFVVNIQESLFFGVRWHCVIVDLEGNNLLTAEVDGQKVEINGVENEGEFSKSMELGSFFKDEVEVVFDGTLSNPLTSALCSFLMQGHTCKIFL